MLLTRRLAMQSAAAAAALAVGLAVPLAARAADPLTVGILIPGSKSDKGWMESGYDGLAASQKKYGDKVKVQMIENINYESCSRIIRGSYRLIADGACRFMGVSPQSYATESDVMRSPEKRSIPLPRKSKSVRNPSFELAMTFLRKCGIYSSKASPPGSHTSR